MLTEEQIFANKKKYMELLMTLGVDLTELFKFLEGHDYFYQPATSQYFNSFDGGLVAYQIKLYEMLKFLVPTLGFSYTDADLIKVSLFKDFYRGFMYEEGSGRTKPDGTQVPTYKTLDPELRITYGDVNFSSYMLAKHFIDFTDEQTLALMYGKPDVFVPDLHEILRSNKLVALVRMADIAVQHLYN